MEDAELVRGLSEELYKCRENHKAKMLEESLKIVESKITIPELLELFRNTSDRDLRYTYSKILEAIGMSNFIIYRDVSDMYTGYGEEEIVIEANNHDIDIFLKGINYNKKG